MVDEIYWFTKNIITYECWFAAVFEQFLFILSYSILICSPPGIATPNAVLFLYISYTYSHPQTTSYVLTQVIRDCFASADYLASALNSNPPNLPSSWFPTSSALLRILHIPPCPRSLPTLPASEPACNSPWLSLCCETSLGLPGTETAGEPKYWEPEGCAPCPIATNRSPEESARMHIMPCSSWIVIIPRLVFVVREWAFVVVVWLELAPLLIGRGLYEDQSVTARVACVRSVEADDGDVLESSFPVGDSSRRVWSCGVADWERKAVSRFVRSIVCDIMRG